MAVELERKPLTEEQKKLVVDNLDFVYWWFHRHHVYDEDRQQNYLYAICRYIHLYDSSKGTITTFLGAILQSRLLTSFKQDQTLRETSERMNVRLNDTVYSGEDGEDVTWEDILGYTDVQLDKIESDNVYSKFLESLEKDKDITKNEYDVLIKYLNVGNQKEVARMNGVRVQAINNALLNIRRKLCKKDYANEIRHKNKKR